MEIGLSQGFFGFIYFDPTDEELITIARTRFDTLRMGVHVENGLEYLVLANGHGCTHSSASHAMGLLNPRLKPSKRDGLRYQGINGGCLILYEERGKWLINASDRSMGEGSQPEDVWKSMKYPARYQLRELIRLLNEQKEV